MTRVSSARTTLASLAAVRTMLPLTSKLALISESSRGLIQNSTLPFGLVSNRSSNSLYPLSFAARKNACKVEWWLSVNRDLLLISTLQPEIRKCSLANLRIARKVPLPTYVACATAPLVGALWLAPHNKRLACDRIASLRHGAKVHLPLPHGGTVRVYRAGGAHRRSEVAPLGF
jgi:hypothetical protein